MDLYCGKNVSPPYFVQAVNRNLPGGVRVIQAQQVSLELPSLQAMISQAEYNVFIATEKLPQEIEQKIASLMMLEELTWQHKRDTGIRRYDLRRLIENLWLISYREGRAVLGMKLACAATGSGRPEQVCLALGIAGYPLAINRTQLFLRTN